jgi:hypothetical protein
LSILLHTWLNHHDQLNVLVLWQRRCSHEFDILKNNANLKEVNANHETKSFPNDIEISSCWEEDPSCENLKKDIQLMKESIVEHSHHQSHDP